MGNYYRVQFIVELKVADDYSSMHTFSDYDNAWDFAVSSPCECVISWQDFIVTSVTRSYATYRDGFEYHCGTSWSGVAAGERRLLVKIPSCY